MTGSYSACLRGPLGSVHCASEFHVAKLGNARIRKNEWIFPSAHQRGMPEGCSPDSNSPKSTISSSQSSVIAVCQDLAKPNVEIVSSNAIHVSQRKWQ